VSKKQSNSAKKPEIFQEKGKKAIRAEEMPTLLKVTKTQLNEKVPTFMSVKATWPLELGSDERGKLIKITKETL
jgi:hypothetical protein